VQAVNGHPLVQRFSRRLENVVGRLGTIEVQTVTMTGIANAAHKLFYGH